MINELIIDKVTDVLQEALIDDIGPSDLARAGKVKRGDLQGDPDPDDARISITVYENDPDAFFTGMTTGISGGWSDEIYERAVGGDFGEAIWNRRFTVKARCLLVNSQEALTEARQIAQTVKKRIEKALLTIDWANVEDEDEYVSRGVFSMHSEALQGGGPPDSYDYVIKVRFDVQTTMSL